MYYVDILEEITCLQITELSLQYIIAIQCTNVIRLFAHSVMNADIKLAYYKKLYTSYK